MQEKTPRDNETVCNLVSIKIKQGEASHKLQDFYGKKVWTVNAKDVEWLTVQLFNDSKQISSIKHKLDQFTKNRTRKLKQFKS